MLCTTHKSCLNNIYLPRPGSGEEPSWGNGASLCDACITQPVNKLFAQKSHLIYKGKVNWSKSAKFPPSDSSDINLFVYILMSKSDRYLLWDAPGCVWGWCSGLGVCVWVNCSDFLTDDSPGCEGAECIEMTARFWSYTVRSKLAQNMSFDWGLKILYLYFCE